MSGFRIGVHVDPACPPDAMYVVDPTRLLGGAGTIETEDGKVYDIVLVVHDEEQAEWARGVVAEFLKLVGEAEAFAAFAEQLDEAIGGMEPRYG